MSFSFSPPSSLFFPSSPSLIFHGMLGSFRPTKWTLLPSFLFRILFLAWVNLKTINLNCGPVAHGSGRQFRVTEAVWQEPTETVNGKAPEVLGFTAFLRVVSTFPHNLTSGIWSLALTTLERRDPEREDNDRLLAISSLRTSSAMYVGEPILFVNDAFVMRVVVSIRTKPVIFPLTAKHALPFLKDNDDRLRAVRCPPSPSRLR